MSNAIWLLVLLSVLVGCQPESQAVDPCQLPTTPIIVVVDDMSCSSCIVLMIDAINKRPDQRIALIVSTGNRPYAEKKLKSAGALLYARNTQDIQRCFDMPTNSAVYRQEGGKLTKVIDVESDNLEEAVAILDALM